MKTSFAVAVAGVAGSGKSTLGRAIAAATGAALIDLDTVTNPLLDRLPREIFGGHWLSSPHAAEIRAGRYAALAATAREVRATAGSVVIVAPFTAELRGGAEWENLRDSVGEDLVFTRLVGDPDILRRRRAQRAEPRDDHRPGDEVTARPGVPHIDIGLELTTPQQLARALVGIGCRSPLPLSAEVFQEAFDAVLFDLDGSLVDSTASVTRSWRRFADENAVTPSELQTNHGRPALALLRALVPHLDLQEGIARITAIELEEAQDLAPVVGAVALFDSVPPTRRAIVTSGARVLAMARLDASGFIAPDVLVTLDDVRHAKPDPEPFLLAAERLGVDPARCVVVEDSPAGIASAKAAGCLVIAVAGTVPTDQLSGADLIVDALDVLTVVTDAAGSHIVPVQSAAEPRLEPSP